MTRDMGESTVQGDMIRMPLPNNGYIMYPVIFVSDAIYRGKYSLFVAQSDNDKNLGVMLATTKNEAVTVLIGNYENLVKHLVGLSWEDDRVKTSDGFLFRKIAPSLEELTKHINHMKNNLT